MLRAGRYAEAIRQYRQLANRCGEHPEMVPEGLLRCDLLCRLADIQVGAQQGAAPPFYSHASPLACPNTTCRVVVGTGHNMPAGMRHPACPAAHQLTPPLAPTHNPSLPHPTPTPPCS